MTGRAFRPLPLFALLFVSLLCLWPQQAKKDIPSLTREAVRAVVLVIASDSTGNEIRQGSGFLVSRDGKVVTNYHVIQEAESAIIKFPNGAFYLVEGLLAADPERDLAILKAAGKDFPFLTLDDSDRVEVGEEIVAIGSPLALEATVSNGIISGIRELENGVFSDGPKWARTTTSNQSLADVARAGIFESVSPAPQFACRRRKIIFGSRADFS